MPAPRPEPGARPAWPAVLLIAAGLLLVRLAYLAWLCPYTLAEDEAHYWDWSRLPDWSYYSKGPGVAWLIWAMTNLLGESELGVRAGAALFGSVATVGVAGMTWSAFRDRRAMLIAVAMFNLIPFYQVGALLMTIDMPYVACAALACWASVNALHRRCRPAWLALGASLAAGFLFKYTIVLLVPGLVGAIVAAQRRADTRHAQAPGLAPGWPKWAFAGLLVALLGLVPVAAWNAQRDWPTVRHLLGHLGAPGGDMGHGEPWTPKWFFEFAVMQVGLVGPALVLMIRGVGRTVRRKWESASDQHAARTLAWLGLPLVIFYFGVAMIADAEGNWAIAGYVPLIPLASRFVSGAIEGRARGERAGSDGYPAWVVCWVVGVVVALGFARLDLLARVPGIGPLVPVGRLAGADVRAASVARELARLRDETGLEPFVIGQHYGRASQLAFYLPGRPRVYCSSSLLAGRRTQFDMWPETDLRRREVNLNLTGRPAVLVGGVDGQWDVAFERVEPLGAIEGETKRDRVSFVGYGYRGFTGPRR